MLWTLREHEGLRAWRWPAAAVGLFAGIWAIPLAGTIGGAYVARAGDGFGWVALSAGVALGFAGLGTYWSKGQPWRRLLADRITAYSESSDPRDYSWALIALADFSRANHALKRGGLNAIGRTAVAPMDAPHLDTTLHVFRPRVCARPGQASVSEDARRILRAAGVFARVDGLLPNGDPVPIIPPRPISPNEPHLPRVTGRRMRPKDPESDVVQSLRSARQ